MRATARRCTAAAAVVAVSALAWTLLAGPAGGAERRGCTATEGCADVSVSGHAEPQPIRRGQTTTLKITPKNDGPGRTFGVEVQATVPNKLKVKRTAISGDGNDHGCSNNGYGFIQCYPGDFSSQELAVVKIRVKAKRKGTYITPVEVFSSGTTDPNRGNNKVRITVGVQGKRG